ncbi:MAG: hypothetical protein WBE46_08685 [Dehalococcoidia bacterium]
MRLPRGVYPERRRDSSLSAQNDTPLSLRGAKGDEAISVGTGDCHASLAMTKKERLRMAGSEGLVMTGKIVSGFMRVTIDSDAHFGRCSL